MLTKTHIILQTVYRQCLQELNETETSVSPQLTAANDSSTIIPTPRNECQKPWSYVPDHVFPNLWRVVYWTSQCLTW